MLKETERKDWRRGFVEAVYSTNAQSVSSSGLLSTDIFVEHVYKKNFSATWKYITSLSQRNNTKRAASISRRNKLEYWYQDSPVLKLVKPVSNLADAPVDIES